MKVLQASDVQAVSGGDGGPSTCTYVGMAAAAVGGPAAGAAVSAACMSLPGMDGGVGTYNSAAGDGPGGTQEVKSFEYTAP